MPTKQIMGFTLGVLILWEGAKALPKMVAARHAREDTGVAKDIAQAFSAVL